MNKPKFISFEGGEGSGKSTQSKKLYYYLLARDIKAIHTREVGGTTEAEKIRDILVHSPLYQTSELMLVMAARYEHINKIIAPAIADNYWVICDRFIDSTACYQSSEHGLSIEEIYRLHHKLMKIYKTDKVMMPDITFFMDLPPDIGLKRSLQTKDVNKFEEKTMHFHNQIYEKFKFIASKFPDRIKTINSGVDELEVHQNIVRFI